MILDITAQYLIENALDSGTPWSAGSYEGCVAEPELMTFKTTYAGVNIQIRHFDDWGWYNNHIFVELRRDGERLFDKMIPAWPLSPWRKIVHRIHKATNTRRVRQFSGMATCWPWRIVTPMCLSHPPARPGT